MRCRPMRCSRIGPIPEWRRSDRVRQLEECLVVAGRRRQKNRFLRRSGIANIQPTDPELAARARRNAMYPELAPEGWTGPDYARKQREAAGWEPDQGHRDG